MSNQSQDAAMFRMMIRTGMVRIWEDEKEIRVEICANPGSSGGLFKSAIPSDDAIPRAAVAEAWAALEPSADWTDLTRAVHSAMVSMGSFQNPLEDGLKGLTPMQWQLEQAKRQSLAVLVKLGLEVKDADR